MFTDDDNSWEDEDDLTKEAVSRFEKMLEDRRSEYFDAEEFELIIDYYMEHDDLQRSREAVDIAIAQHPYDINIRIKQARQSLMENDPEKALELLSNTEINYDEPDYFLTLGSCYSALGIPHQAIDTYLKALPYFDEDEKGELYHAIGYSYKEMSDYDNAINYYKKAIENTDDDLLFKNTLFELSHCFLLSRKQQEGIDYFKQRIENNPHEVESWSILGDIYRKTERLEEAIDHYEYALAIDPSHLWANMHIANAYYDLNRFKEAIDSLNEAIAHHVETSMIHASLGDCYYRLEQYIDAKNEYRKALDINDNLTEAWAGLGYVYSDTGDSTHAIQYFEKAPKNQRERESPFLSPRNRKTTTQRPRLVFLSRRPAGGYGSL